MTTMTSMTGTYETRERKDSYGVKITTIVAHPDLMTAQEAARSIGISTRKLGFVQREVEGCWPTAKDGTEMNKYPVFLFTPEQVARIAEAAPLFNGNGRRIG